MHPAIPKLPDNTDYGALLQSVGIESSMDDQHYYVVGTLDNIQGLDPVDIGSAQPIGGSHSGCSSSPCFRRDTLQSYSEPRKLED